MTGIRVVHLVWAPLGLDPLRRFAGSYRRHPAGLEHRLTVVFKEFRDGERLREARAALDGLDYDELHMPGRALDLKAYIVAAEQLEAEHFFFCNSNSELLAPDWLRTMHARLTSPGVGLAAATGSWESFYSAAAPWQKPLRRVRFPPFPNPHARTNAFMLSRELMLSLGWPKVRRKRSAWALESGRGSVTQRVHAQGLRVLVVGRDGEGYEATRWPESRTFRSGEQENLLVADNRTRQYADADEALRRHLATLAWGDRA